MIPSVEAVSNSSSSATVGSRHMFLADMSAVFELSAFRLAD